MKIAYLDCFSGISGDMTLGALLDSGIDEAAFRSEIAKLTDIEFKLNITKTSKGSITATDAEVVIYEEHHHRHLHTIVDIINRSALSDYVKTNAVNTFHKLAEAEGKVHGTSPEEVHFHEVGAVDAIVDIVGSSIGFEMLGVDKIIASPLPTGYGFVNAAHGIIPIPAPATVELLKGIPIYSTDIEGELVTPTGAAIITNFAEEFRKLPMMKLQSTSYGAGKKNFGIPNVLRMFIGEIETAEILNQSCNVAMVETNIDDMNPEFYEILFERLFEIGALDVYLSPIQMKKNRPATLLSVICSLENVNDIAITILQNTSSFGVRISKSERVCLDRRWENVNTQYGQIKLKIGMFEGKELKASPEYEDCKSAAKEHNVSIYTVYESAIKSYNAK